MTKVLVPVATALALISGLACKRQVGFNRNTNRTMDNASIAGANRTGTPAENGSRDCLNLNTASAEELALLPGIGAGLAAKIIEYRSKHGRLERPQDIIIIDGFGERRYHKIERFICAY